MDNQSYIEQVKALKHVLDNLPPSNKEQKEKLWMKLRLEWIYQGSLLDGNTLTHAEIESLITSGQLTEGKDPQQSEAVKALDKAIRMVADESRAKSKPLTESFVQLLFSKLTNTDFTLREDDGGLFNWYNKQKDIDPVILAAKFYYRFIRLYDGDKAARKSAQLLMNYILLKNDFPPVIIRADDQENYDLAMHTAERSDVNAFVEYIASLMLASLDLSIKVLSPRKSDDADAWKKKLNALKQSLPEDDEAA
jgi:Fic family protein